jgi:hypothetical protein
MLSGVGGSLPGLSRPALHGVEEHGSENHDAGYDLIGVGIGADLV